MYPAEPKRYFPGMADLNIFSLADMCQQVYFPTEDHSTAFVIVMMAGLWELLHNLGHDNVRQQGISESEIEDAKSLLKHSIDDAARSMPLLLDHSYRQIQALFLLVSRVQKTTIVPKLTLQSRAT